MCITNPPERLYYVGNLELLSVPIKVGIVGSRKPNIYSQHQTRLIAKEISALGGVVISGGALGIDIIAHSAAMPNTIMFSPCSLDYIYPPSNAKFIKQIAKEGLIISEYENKELPQRYDFLHRNRLVIGLSDVVLIPQADLQSGSMQSSSITLKQQKPLYVLPHHLGESSGTQRLLQHKQAMCIHDVKAFLADIGLNAENRDENNDNKDEILLFCASSPSFDEAYSRFGDILFEYELEGKIMRSNGRVVLC